MKVLYISQEITPYLPESVMSLISRKLPQSIQEQGREIRTFMPKYGCINERRNQLHEVLRLSGMNLIINDMDHPLTIKVASIQAARMQVYFIDNEDFFGRKATLFDPEGSIFPDTDERMMFFCQGVLETIKKLRWVPDIIHCQGWFTSLIPIFVKKLYKDEPILSQSKVVYSLYNDNFVGSLNPSFKSKLISSGISEEDINDINLDSYEDLSKLAINWADALIQTEDIISESLADIAKQSQKIMLPYQGSDYASAYSDFYDKISE